MQYEIFLLLIGAAIGFISSIGTTIVTELMKRQGKVKLYYKIVFSKVSNGGTWGFHNSSSELVFEVPLWIELLNTSNTVRVVRDLNILLYRNGKEISEMKQITNLNDTWYGDEGAYSFVLQPRSMKSYNLEFLIKKKDMGEDFQFDEIRLRYFDEKDNKHLLKLITIERCWELGNLNRESIGKLAKK